MISNRLSSISTIVLLRSDKILHELLQNKEYKSKTSSISNSIKDYTPDTFRLNDIQAIMSSNHIDYDYASLEDFFDEFYTFDAFNIYAKKEKLESYTSVINKIHPFCIIGHKMALFLYNGTIDKDSFKSFTDNISPLGFFAKTQKRYSDNHLHLGGANDPILNMWDLINSKNKTKYFQSDFMGNLPRVNEFSYVNTETFSLGILHNLVNLCLSTIYRYVLNEKTDTKSIWCEFQAILKAKENYIAEDLTSIRVLSEMQLNPSNTEEELLALFLYYDKCHEPIRRWFVLNTLCHYIHKTCDSFMMKRVIKIFFHITNIIYSYQVMGRSVGLKNFVEYFTSSVRQVSKDKYNNIAANIINTGTKTFEAKIAPSAVFENEFIKYKIAFDKYILEKDGNKNTDNYQKYFLLSNSSEYKYHFSIHFVRKSENNPDTLKQRFTDLRKEVKQDALKLHKFLYEHETKFPLYYFYAKHHPNKITVERYKKELENKYIDISKMFSSIDIAGDELETPPEVFASAIKYLRHQPKKKAQADYKRLILSVHAGEDFNHLISGMRKIDETIEFYKMQKNDRIGHALAIGIYPKEWISQNFEMIVSKEELLDNYVWMVEQFKQISSHTTLLFGVIHRYQNYISDLSKEIYETSYSAYDLYKAWKLREYDLEELEKDFTNDPFHKSSKPKNNIIRQSNEYQIYKMYHTNEKVKKEGKIKVKLRYSSAKGIYTICDDDLVAFEMIQDYMIEKLSQKEIIIETNPSSNIYTSCLKNYSSHPIFRWYPVDRNIEDFNKYGIRKNLLKVCINTDDPSIFPTTISNEFEHLTNAVSDKYSKNEIERWSEDLRVFGNEIFDDNHQEFEFER